MCGEGLEKPRRLALWAAERRCSGCCPQAPAGLIPSGAKRTRAVSHARPGLPRAGGCRGRKLGHRTPAPRHHSLSPSCRARRRARGAVCAGTARTRCGARTAPPPSTGAATSRRARSVPGEWSGQGSCEGWGGKATPDPPKPLRSLLGPACAASPARETRPRPPGRERPSSAPRVPPPGLPRSVLRG